MPISPMTVSKVVYWEYSGMLQSKKRTTYRYSKVDAPAPGRNYRKFMLCLRCQIKIMLTKRSICAMSINRNSLLWPSLFLIKVLMASRICLGWIIDKNVALR